MGHKYDRYIHQTGVGVNTARYHIGNAVEYIQKMDRMGPQIISLIIKGLNSTDASSSQSVKKIRFTHKKKKKEELSRVRIHNKKN